MEISPGNRTLIEAGAHAHLITLNPDSSLHVTVAWIRIEDDEIVGPWTGRPV